MYRTNLFSAFTLLTVTLMVSGTAMAETTRSFYRVVDLDGTGSKAKMVTAPASSPSAPELVTPLPSPLPVAEPIIIPEPVIEPAVIPVAPPTFSPVFESIPAPETVIDPPVQPPQKINDNKPIYQRYTRPVSSVIDPPTSPAPVADSVISSPTITPTVAPAELPPPVALPDEEMAHVVATPAPVVQPIPTVSSVPSSNNYILGAGDVLRVTVYGDENLSGEFIIDASGSISMPLIQEVPATGLTTRALENAIIARLTPQYLTDAKVSVQVIEYRSVYVMGEVRLPGKYPYVPNMTMLQAVAVAGGHTYRANEETAEISRQNNGTVERITATADTLVMPGDTVVIKRRWF